ncbi:hypothetical protein AAFC00_003974 [Neodothiora populina]|uniref:NAD(P)-binding protein n=1 Tax=Neodothiora populina TaxID=2781224 RepID=A0ABR3PIC5_9PEZI
MSDQMVVIVTGANRGIGRAICEQILARSRKQSLRLYATSRGGQDLEFNIPSDATVLYPALDITSGSSIQSLAQRIQNEDDGQVDVLINNAGVNTSPEHTPSSVQKTLDTNYRGTLNMCRTFLPFVSASSAGRIVNVSSVGSSLHIYSEQIASRFRNPDMTLAELEDMAREYQSAVERKEEDDGWGGKGRAYSVSKACVNALTAILTREQQNSKGGQAQINACCPGWVNTDMGGLVGKPPKKPEDGARIPVRLGFGDIGRVTGRYWANPGISDTGDGKVVEW